VSRSKIEVLLVQKKLSVLFSSRRKYIFLNDYLNYVLPCLTIQNPEIPITKCFSSIKTLENTLFIWTFRIGFANLIPYSVVQYTLKSQFAALNVLCNRIIILENYVQLWMQYFLMIYAELAKFCLLYLYLFGYKFRYL